MSERASEAMVDAAFRAKPLPPMRASREHYRLALEAALALIDGPGGVCIRDGKVFNCAWHRCAKCTAPIAHG